MANIYEQIPSLKPPIPLFDLAEACGIYDFRDTPSDHVEGMLVSDPEKSKGVIFYNQASQIGRQRFTIGHELGHFVMLSHDSHSSCSSNEIHNSGSSIKVDDDKKLKQEKEANRFSALLLMPEDHIYAAINKYSPCLKYMFDISEKFQMSFSPIANKCASLSSRGFCLIHCKDNQVLYVWRDWKTFPHQVKYDKGSILPEAPMSTSLNAFTDLTPVNAKIWLQPSKYKPLIPDILLEQTYFQENGYKIIMLSYC